MDRYKWSDRTTNVTISRGSIGNRNYTANWELPGGSIAGIVIGSIAAVAVIIVCAVLLVKYKCKQHPGQEDSSEVELEDTCEIVDV